MHREAMAFIERAAQRIGPVTHVVEFGARDVNGSAREAFSAADVRWVGIDRQDGPGVDVVLDLEQDDLELDGFDLGVCCEVLEHVRHVHVVFDRLIDAVDPGGHVLVTCATEPRGAHGCDGGPVGREWYRNVAPWELVRENLEVLSVEVHADRGDLYLLARKVDQ